jgi:hypothetical protein
VFDYLVLVRNNQCFMSLLRVVYPQSRSFLSRPHVFGLNSRDRVVNIQHVGHLAQLCFLPTPRTPQPRQLSCALQHNGRFPVKSLLYFPFEPAVRDSACACRAPRTRTTTTAGCGGLGSGRARRT